MSGEQITTCSTAGDAAKRSAAVASASSASNSIIGHVTMPSARDASSAGPNCAVQVWVDAFAGLVAGIQVVAKRLDHVVERDRDVRDVRLAERHDQPSGTMIVVAHNGYEARFGLIHERRIMLSQDGKSLGGTDRLHAAKAGEKTSEKAGEQHPFAIRFHIHPNVRLKRVREGRSVLCILPNGKRWLFENSAGQADIEESVFFAAPDGPRSCAQIAVHGETGPGTVVEWSFRHIERKASRGEG